MQHTPPRVRVFKIMLCPMGPREANNTVSKSIGEKFVAVPKSLNAAGLKTKERHGGVPVAKKSPLNPLFRPLSLKIK